MVEMGAVCAMEGAMDGEGNRCGEVARSRRCVLDAGSHDVVELTLP